MAPIDSDPIDTLVAHSLEYPVCFITYRYPLLSVTAVTKDPVGSIASLYPDRSSISNPSES